jgi:hypothetical protein
VGHPRKSRHCPTWLAVCAVGKSASGSQILAVGIPGACRGQDRGQGTSGSRCDARIAGTGGMPAPTTDILSRLSSAWGWHRTRSRLGPWPVPGKAVWCCIPVTALCEPPQHPQLPIHQAAEALRALLAARGIDRIICNHDHNRSLVSLPSGLTIWSEQPGVFRWKDPGGDTHLQTTADLTDVTETAVRLHEDLHAAEQLNDGQNARTAPPCPPRIRSAKDGWMRFHLSHLPRAAS